MPNSITDQGSDKLQELNVNYFDEFINKNAWEPLELKLNKGKIKDAETKTDENAARVLNKDTAIPRFVLMDRAEIATHLSSTTERSSNVIDNIAYNAFPDKTGQASVNGKHHFKKPLKNNCAATGNHDPSKSQGSVCTLGTSKTFSWNLFNPQQQTNISRVKSYSYQEGRGQFKQRHVVAKF